MAVKIERGGWVLIFLIGVAIVGYSLNRYGFIDLSKGSIMIRDLDALKRLV